MKSIFEEMGGTHTLGEDGMYYPDLELPVDEDPHYGKYGRMRKAYIKEHRPWLYTELLFSGKPVSHLNSIDILLKMKAITVLYLRTSDGLHLNADLMPKLAR